MEMTGKEFRNGVSSPQSPQEIEILMGFPGSGAGVEGPCEVLRLRIWWTITEKPSMLSGQLQCTSYLYSSLLLVWCGDAEAKKSHCWRLHCESEHDDEFPS